MSVIRVGSTGTYADGWDHVFGAGKGSGKKPAGAARGKAAAGKSAAKAGGKKSGGKKKVKKAARRK